jgi:hypothetical protein
MAYAGQKCLKHFGANVRHNTVRMQQAILSNFAGKSFLSLLASGIASVLVALLVIILIFAALWQIKVRPTRLTCPINQSD